MTEGPAHQPADENAPTPLAKREDFSLGSATIRPSLRTVEGPLGSTRCEPRVLQVLLALADARGRVLTREDLLRLCWDNRIVGDDAINRAVSEVRRLAIEVGADFEVETVPRIGYRLSGILWEEEALAANPKTRRARPDRRRLLAGATIGILLLAGGGTAIVYRNRRKEVDALIERGRELQAGGIEGDSRAEAFFREAIARDPNRADAWGWLSVVLNDHQAARDAALRAVEFDPREPNARAVLAYQRRDLDAWTQWEDALLGILADAPDNALALGQLTLFYQGMGRCRDSWDTNERAIRIEPFQPGNHARRALKHWIFGRISEADKVADQSLELWPRHSIVWNARMLIFACTDRASAALALLNDVSLRPANLTEPSIRSWRAALRAIDTRVPEDIARAISVCTATASLAPGLAANAIMFFSYLQELNAAYHVAAGLLENRGPVVQQRRGSGIRDVYSGSAWGRTQFLFIPATAPFRADARFPGLCETMGHVAYWKRRGIWPDPFVRGAIDPARLS